MWLYILKHKDDALSCFLEWKALVQRSTNQKLKALCTDHDGKYMSSEFQFWAEELSTAVSLRNRGPVMAVKGMTPFEAWMGEKPNVEHLRVFGCAADAHVANGYRKKLDIKSRKCILLGYGTETKGYQLYDLKFSTIGMSYSMSPVVELRSQTRKKRRTRHCMWNFVVFQIKSLMSSQLLMS